jgi:dipeptidyl aminopeptidase/acylaminoacyl peptidase
MSSSPITQASGSARGSLYISMRQQGLWTREVTGLDPQVDAAALRRYCPVLNATRHYPPTMLLHGTADTDVPFAQSVAMRDALVRAGVTCELVALPGKDHGFDFDQRDAEVLDAVDRAEAFLDAKLHPH